MTITEHENWRKLELYQRHEFRFWLDEQMQKRLEKGRKKYGDKFQGNPMDHLIEELLDGLFYAYMTKKYVQSLKSDVNDLENALDRCGG